MNATMTNSLVPNTTVPTELQKQEDLDDDSSTSSNSSSSSSSSTSSNDDDDDYDESISYDDDDDDDEDDATPAASTKAVAAVAAVKRPKKLVGTIPSDIRRSAAKLYGFKPPCGIDNDDSDDDDDDSSDDGDNMLSRAMQGLRRTSLENGVDLDPHHNHHDNDCSDSNGTDYGYDDDCGLVAEEDQPKVHYRRRNSCLIQEGQDPFSAAAAQDSLLGGDGPPLMSDRDLEFEQERKAELVIAMYNQ